MARVHTATDDRWAAVRVDASRLEELRIASEDLAVVTLREWCERRSHPRSKLMDGECFCGLVRYDD